VQLFARLKGKRAGKMDSHLLKDFVKAGDVPAALIQKYQNKLPEELLAIWRHYGFGAFQDGFFKVVNPERCRVLMHAPFSKDSVPMLATGFGDLIVYRDQKYFELLRHCDGTCRVLTGDAKKFFGECLKDPAFLEEHFDWSIYQKALEKYGPPKHNECFFYAPPLIWGAPKQAENLHIGKISNTIRMQVILAGKIQRPDASQKEQNI